MKFYHGTSKENWDTIQKEGILFGRRYILNTKRNVLKEVKQRCTYLAVEQKEAECYGEIVLEVEYDPLKIGSKNNYCKGCWQMRVYEPIKIENIKRIK